MFSRIPAESLKSLSHSRVAHRAESVNGEARPARLDDDCGPSRQDQRPVAVIRSPLLKGRLLSECIALAEARGTTAIPDEGFMKECRGRDRGMQQAIDPAILGVRVPFW